MVRRFCMFFIACPIDSSLFVIEILHNPLKFFEIHWSSAVGLPIAEESQNPDLWWLSTNFTEWLRALSDTLSLRFVDLMDIFRDCRKQIFDCNPHFCALELQNFPKSWKSTSGLQLRPIQIWKPKSRFVMISRKFRALVRKNEKRDRKSASYNL